MNNAVTMYALVCESIYDGGSEITAVHLRTTREAAIDLMKIKHAEALSEADEGEELDHDFCPIAGSAYIAEYAEFSVHECEEDGDE